jgi:hypothetical protein
MQLEEMYNCEGGDTPKHEMARYGLTFSTLLTILKTKAKYELF